MCIYAAKHVVSGSIAAAFWMQGAYVFFPHCVPKELRAFARQNRLCAGTIPPGPFVSPLHDMPLIRWDGGAAGRQRQAEHDRQRRIRHALERKRQEREWEQELAEERAQEQQRHQERDKCAQQEQKRQKIHQSPDIQDTLAMMLDLGEEKPPKLWGVLKPSPDLPIDLE